jgi:hypothetical protein
VPSSRAVATPPPGRLSCKRILACAAADGKGAIAPPMPGCTTVIRPQWLFPTFGVGCARIATPGYIGIYVRG